MDTAHHNIYFDTLWIDHMSYHFSNHASFVDKLLSYLTENKEILMFVGSENLIALNIEW